MKRWFWIIFAVGVLTLTSFGPAFAWWWCPHPKPHEVPEPDSLILLASGVSAVVGAWRIKRGLEKK